MGARSEGETKRELRKIPGVDRLLQHPLATALLQQYGHDLAVGSAQNLLEGVRHAISSGAECPPTEELVARLATLLAAITAPSLVPVINATGVIIHTNLGRAPLSSAAQDALRQASHYGSLEFDLDAGRRGSRYVHAERLLCRLTGAEAALVVNNAAGAVLLILTGVARGRDVVISRGQLVEIGGGFRIPEVMAQSGAHLVEVGTTNRTRIEDYRDAIVPETAALLRVHTSNFRMTGFVEATELADLVALGHAHGLTVVDDLGSGALLDTADFGLSHEPTVQESLASGADLVTFSGDKLLGGPQAGVILGTSELVAGLRRHPLTRALRVSKFILAALQATLIHYLKGEALSQVPVWRMISTPLDVLEERAAALAQWLVDAGAQASIVDSFSTVGGGSLPGETLPTRAIALRLPSPNELAHRLRAGSTPVVARVEDDALLLDIRTVPPWQDESLRQALAHALRG